MIMTNMEETSVCFPFDPSTALRERVFFSARDGMSLTLHSLLCEKNQNEIDDLLNNDIYYQGIKCTPLIVAARNGREGSVRLLLEKYKPLVKLETEGTVKFDDYVIEGLNRQHYGITGATALWCAAGAGHLGIVKRLVRAGANVNHATKTLSTPLRAACFDGRLDIVKYLVRHGADIHMSNKYNNTCLMISAYKGHLDVVQFLLDSGAGVDDRALCGATALHFAAECGHAAIVDILLYHGAKIMKNENGMTPLHCAAERARDTVVNLLASRPEVDRLDAAQSYELLGASYANDKEFYCLRKAFLYLNTAMNMRNAPLFNLPPKVPLPPVPAYDNWRESVTEEDLERLHGNPHAIHMEGLTIRERILGRSCPDLPHPIVFRGAVFADEAKFDKCLALWRHALLLRQENNVSLTKDLLRFAQVFSQMINIDVVAEVSLEQVNFVLDVCAEEISRSSRRLEHPPPNCDIETLVEEYESNLRTALYLVSIASKLLENPGHDLKDVIAVKRTISNLRNVRFKSGHTLLHSAVDHQMPVDDFHTRDVCRFPCSRTASLLMECNFDVNARNEYKRTPLHVLFQSFLTLDEERDSQLDTLSCIIMDLVSWGAHMDAMDRDGNTSFRAFTGTILGPFVRSLAKPELKCIAATAMAKHRIKYRKREVPKVLHSFLEIHGVLNID